MIKIFGPLILIIFALLLFYHIKNSNRTVYNEEYAYGNTAGNLFNGGLFCVYDDKIYFSNINDNGTLYSMDLNCDNFKKINDDKPEYINAVGNYIYYARMNYKKQYNTPNVFALKNAGIFRIDLNGSNIKNLYDNPSGLINVYGNNLYYQRYDSKDGLNFYKIGIDGSGEKKLSEQPIVPMTIVNNILYYAGTQSDHSIYSMNLITGSISTVYKGNCYAPVFNNDYIYYISVSDNYSIYRVNLNGDSPDLILNERCSTYNITEDGKYLYFQADNNENNRIGKLNIQTGETDAIKKGDFKNIHIAGNYVFFMDFAEKEAYFLPAGPVNNASTFRPPKLTDEN